MVQYFPIVTGSLTVTGSVNVSGSITTNSTITATTLVVQTITSSISAITGSTNFGSLSTNTHTFTGSINASGSANFSGSLTVNGAATLGTGTSSYTFGGGSAAAGNLTDKDLTLKAWSPTSGTNEYGGDLILQSGVGTGNASGKLGSVIIKVGTDGATSSTLGTYITSTTFTKTGVGINTSNPVSLGASYTTLEIKGQSGLYGGAIQLTSADGTNKGRVYTANDTFWVGTSNSLPLGFITADAERMRITSGGYTKISNTGAYEYINASVHEIRNSAADYILYSTNPHASNPSGFYISYPAAAPNNTSNFFIACADSSAARFRVASNGNCYNVTGTYTSGVSDVRYKEQIVDANSQWDDIKNLRVVNFKFKKDVEENGENALRQIGFIAQEVEAVSPNLIDEMSDEKTGETWKTIKASIIHTKAIKALQEAMARIEQLEARVQELENK